MVMALQFLDIFGDVFQASAARVETTQVAAQARERGKEHGFLALSLSIYRSIDLSIYRSIDPSIYLSIDWSIDSIDRSIYQSFFLWLHIDTLNINVAWYLWIDFTYQGSRISRCRCRTGAESPAPGAPGSPWGDFVEDDGNDGMIWIQNE